MKKQTAVDILIQRYYGNEGQLTIKDLEQAKEMEKQQLNDAYNADRPNLTCYEENTAFKEYYKETFKP